MKKARKKLLISAAVAAVILATHAVWLPLAAGFLTLKDNIKKADAVAVLSGDWRFDRERLAIELYKRGLAEKIIRVLEKENQGFEMVKTVMGLNLTQKEAYAGYFGANGVPPGSVILGHAIATSTFDEMKVIRDIALKHNIKSIILVTGDYHMRRSLITAKWYFRVDGITVYHATAHSEDFMPGRWWLHEKDIRGVVFEYLSLVLYCCYHFVTGR